MDCQLSSRSGGLPNTSHILYLPTLWEQSAKRKALPRLNCDTYSDCWSIKSRHSKQDISRSLFTHLLWWKTSRHSNHFVLSWDLNKLFHLSAYANQIFQDTSDLQIFIVIPTLQLFSKLLSYFYLPKPLCAKSLLLHIFIWTDV